MHRQSDSDDVSARAIATDGQEEWFMEIDGRGVGPSPTLVGRRLYFGGTGMKMYIVR